jgi:hypothetical protein
MEPAGKDVLAQQVRVQTAALRESEIWLSAQRKRSRQRSTAVPSGDTDHHRPAAVARRVIGMAES